MPPALSTPYCRLSKASGPQPFAERLLAWWDQHGRKTLPWQQLGSAYGFWIAEVMLQQTQVSTVIPYFQKFLQRFPSLPSLAQASVDDVLAHWSGLGYYSRARNLHKTALICQREHAGQLPAEPAQLHALPGIGLSTANAIISQSSDRVLPILDGNVKRVLARHAGVAGWPGQTKVARQLWAIAARRLPDRRGAAYTQASMDLGALVCTRSRPDCQNCPANDDCHALRHDQISLLPGKKPKLNKTEQAIDMLLIRDARQRVLLQRRPPAGIWGGLWSLPEQQPEQQLEKSARKMPLIRHELTHRSLLITPWSMQRTDPSTINEAAQQQWFTIKQALAVGLPQPVRKLLEELE